MSQNNLVTSIKVMHFISYTVSFTLAVINIYTVINKLTFIHFFICMG